MADLNIIALFLQHTWKMFFFPVVWVRKRSLEPSGARKVYFQWSSNTDSLYRKGQSHLMSPVMTKFHHTALCCRVLVQVFSST